MTRTRTRRSSEEKDEDEDENKNKDEKEDEDKDEDGQKSHINGASSKERVRAELTQDGSLGKKEITMI